MPPSYMKKQVKVLIQPGIVPLDLIGPVQVIESANQFIRSEVEFHQYSEFEIEYIGEQDTISWCESLQLSKISPLPISLKHTELLLIPGIYSDTPITNNICFWLKNRTLEANNCMAICSGALILAKAGLLAFKRATTHHSLLAKLEEISPSTQVEKGRIFVRDCNFITSAGISSGIDTLLAWLVEHTGHDLAYAVAKDLVLPMRRSGYSPQLTGWLEGRVHGDKVVHHVQDLMSIWPEKSWTIQKLSDEVALGERQLRRRFKLNTGVSLSQYHRRIRLDRAQMLMRETSMPLYVIAEAIGLSDERHLRRLWRSENGMSPLEWRSVNKQSF